MRGKTLSSDHASEGESGIILLGVPKAICRRPPEAIALQRIEYGHFGLGDKENFNTILFGVQAHFRFAVCLRSRRRLLFRFLCTIAAKR